MKKTPLYDVHIALKGKVIDFGGWALPVQYSGIVAEHTAVREAAGLFDVSHMGEILVEGPDALTFINRIVTNDIRGKADGQIIYSPMCHPHGGTVDDLQVCQYSPEKFLLVVNAANKDKDFAWITAHQEGNVTITDLSDEYALLALQGPKAQEILSAVTDADLNAIRFYHFAPDVTVAGLNATIARSGYTGEDGFEIYVASKDGVALWNALMAAGAPLGLIPAGLGARDSLRFEAGLPLYGNELTDDITPLEAGLGKFVKTEEKDDFIGRDALAAQRAEGLKRKICRLEMLSGGIPRHGYDVQADGRVIGHVTSGGMCPTLKKVLASALVEIEYAQPDTEVAISVRDRLIPAKITQKQSLHKNYKK